VDWLIGLDLDPKMMAVPSHSGSGCRRNEKLGHTTEAGDLLYRLLTDDPSARTLLIYLARSYHGAEGIGSNHHTDGIEPGERLAQVAESLEE
jgi:hypothetical protein